MLKKFSYYIKQKKIKLLLNLKKKTFVSCIKLKSKIFYNLNFLYIKHNFLLINQLIQFKSFSNSTLQNHYQFIDNEIYNDSFILNYLSKNFDNKIKLNIELTKNKKTLSLIALLRKILFSNTNFFRLLKVEKKILKTNIYHIYLFLFYYYMKNNLYYKLFLKINNKRKRKLLINLNIFSKKNLKKSFNFFFKNIILFLYKFYTIKNENHKLVNIVQSFNNIIKKKQKSSINRFHLKPSRFKIRKSYFLKRRNINFTNTFLYKNQQFLKNKYHIYLSKSISRKFELNKFNLFNIIKKKISKTQVNKFIHNRNKLIKYIYNITINNKNKFIPNFLSNDYSYFKQKLLQKPYFIKLKKKFKKIKFKNFNLNTKIIKYKKLISDKILNIFKKSLKKNDTELEFNNKFYYFKKLFIKKLLLKRKFELYFKTDNSLKNSINILKNNKKFKFLTFPTNCICKFFFKKSMYNIFMTLVVFPLNLTIINYSGGYFNILSKRRDRGSINSLKSLSKIMALKIYQSNLSFIIFCPCLITNNNKRLIKTIFYSFKILNRSPITKIYLYRPVIRNGIRAKKIPRK